MMSVSLMPASNAERLRDTRKPLARLLVVDDVADNRDILARRFTLNGFEVVQAESGEEALDLIGRESFDVVLLDVMMPGISGMDALQLMRRRHSASELPIVMVTAKSHSDDISLALERGANDYVTKPVDFGIAHARVVAQLERKRLHEEIKNAHKELLLANSSLEEKVNERTARLLAMNDQLRREIEVRLESEAKSRFLAHHDALTGLPNRTLFHDELTRALATARQTGAEVAILFIDLDGFKCVNDTLGHSVGDNLLREIGGHLSEIIGESDLAARLGGDEFAILQTSGTQPLGASILASQVIEAISEHRVVGESPISVGASVGIAVFKDGEHSDAETLLKNADLAMYRAKSDGRGAYRVFSPEMDSHAQERRAIEMDLRLALQDGQFELHYQPLISIETKKICCFEALVRWKHPLRGMVAPNAFIPVAEEMGFIVALGEWVLREACREAASWPNDIRVAVNVSPIQFIRGDLIATVLNALASAGLPPHRLELEITESVLLEKTDRNFELLRQIQELGVKVSMDDFGTGYSSLAYLRRFRFDKIKIDQSFVRDLHVDSQSVAIVRAIAQLGATFGIPTTAEGVETPDQFSRVQLEGCHEAQGRFFSMPMPASKLRGFIEEQLGD